MATSGTVTYSINTREAITRALRRVNVIAMDEPPSADHADVALGCMNEMLKTWGVSGPYLWKKKEGSITLTADTQSFDLAATLNPLRVLSVRYRDTNSNDLPTTSMSRDEYFNLTVKDSQGIPTRWYFDPQRGAPTLYIWPVKASVTTETLKVTYQARIEDVGLDDDMDIPQEWMETVVYNLADRLLDEYGVADAVAQRITARAAKLLQDAKDYERDDFVDFIMEVA